MRAKESYECTYPSPMKTRLKPNAAEKENKSE